MVDTDTDDDSIGDPPMEQVLLWIGFDGEDDRNTIMTTFGSELEDFLTLTEDEISDEIKAMGNRRTAAERFSFGLKRAQKFKGIMHWVKDLDCVNKEPYMGALDQLSFERELENSLRRAKIRADTAKDRQSRSQAAMPDKLKDEKTWEPWEAELLNMLSIQEGVNGVPLVYVVRENDHVEGTKYASFAEECISKAKLSGPHFEADAKHVHQIIMTLTIGENAEQWLKEHMKKANGRLDMESLRNHFRGAGNKSRRIAEATRLMETLHYRNEKALAFNVFISKAKKMFNIFDECGEGLQETRKLRFLWENIQDPKLGPTIEAIKANLGRDPESWSFIDAAAHMAAQIPAIGKQSKHLSALGSSTPGSENNQHDHPSSGIMKDGKVFTGSYRRFAWNKLSNAEKNQVFAAREGSAPSGNNFRKAKTVKALQKRLNKQSKKIQEQSRKLSALTRGTESSDESSDDSSGSANAGNQFGGKGSRVGKPSAKKKRKNS